MNNPNKPMIASLKNETLENESNDSKQIGKLNEKIRKYEDIIDKKNKEITKLQMDQENYKKKFSNYSEHNSSIAIRNASLERTLKEVAIEKLKLEKENVKLKENIACLEGQLSEQRLMMKEYFSSHPAEPKILPTPINSQTNNSSKIEKPFQLKITKYLKKTSTISEQICLRTPPPQPPRDIPVYASPTVKSPERSTSTRKKVPYFGRYRSTPIKKDRIEMNIQAVIVNSMLDDDEIIF